MSWSWPICICSIIITIVSSCLASSQSGTVFALAGRNSVLIATDSRFSTPSSGSYLVGQFPRPVYWIGKRVLVSSCGLECDTRHMMNILKDKLVHLKECDLSPELISRSLSNILYKSDLSCSPVVVGFSRRNCEQETPYICNIDSLGAQTISNTFACTGSSSPGLYGICESLYGENLPFSDLQLDAEKCLKLAFQRDISSGGASRIYTLIHSSEGPEVMIKDCDISDV